ncbi:MAG: peptide chain release factor-like protein [Verrucomicrobia bacterium]|nr:peptide chain release factor-like protein [Verrucomicrobiota bacterium]MBS0635971.1 peptide chain release factor-like protein [Verrucomicrobiota bacterium]
MVKIEDILVEMAKLGITEADLVEKFILGSGRGGQNLQKTSSCVYLKHIPSGLEVKCQQTRSRELNRIYARRELCEKIASQILKIKTEKIQEIEKKRRQKRKRSKRAQEKVLEAKKRRSSIKQLRKV